MIGVGLRGLGRGGDDIICNRLLRGWFLLLRPFQDGDGFDVPRVVSATLSHLFSYSL